ncbi:hypothetical protein [Gracilimonas sp.]|uniref:hypothetical protein n=1 Tax=Gracilimonas sp. TaxID=1974203 RepID=UPI002872A76E|nr:hypothetical protein [Gracilimonas sp.]
MKNLRPYLPLFLIILGIIFLAKIVQVFFLMPLIESAFQGESFEYLNKLLNKHQLKDPTSRDLQYYQQLIPQYINRLILIGVIAAIFFWDIFRIQQRKFKKFLLEEKSPVNLAVLRISVLSLILYSNFPATAYELSQLGRDAIVAPTGWGSICH